ncbi:MAG: arginine repressor [Clostridia bacterium]|nr:arginine repressor [Clostridia bacterium]
MTKKDRLNLILKVIEEEEIENQNELTEALIRRGYNSSQATVSRDVNELNLVKAKGLKKKFKYVRGEIDLSQVPSKFIDLFKQVSLSITSANNLIVIKTLSGNAGTAAMAIDEMHSSEILGTVAGDDTLLIVTKNNSDAEILVKKLRNI